MLFLKCRAVNSPHTDILLNLSQIKIIEESLEKKTLLKITDMDGRQYTCRKDAETQFGISESVIDVGGQPNP